MNIGWCHSFSIGAGMAAIGAAFYQRGIYFLAEKASWTDAFALSIASSGFFMAEMGQMHQLQGRYIRGSFEMLAGTATLVAGIALAFWHYGFLKLPPDPNLQTCNNLLDIMHREKEEQASRLKACEKILEFPNPIL